MKYLKKLLLINIVLNSISITMYGMHEESNKKNVRFNPEVTVISFCKSKGGLQGARERKKTLSLPQEPLLEMKKDRIPLWSRIFLLGGLSLVASVIIINKIMNDYKKHKVL